jgi:Tetratricopeptide repeat
MPASRITIRIVLMAGISLVAPAAGAQQPKLEPGMKVLARSPDFVLRDGDKVVPLGSPFDGYRVERVEGARVRLYNECREGDARATDVVRIEQAEAYFSDQIKANPRAVHGYLMRCVVRASFQHDPAGALADCEEAIRLEPKNPWAYLMRGEIKGQQHDQESAIIDFDQAIRLDERIAYAYVCRAYCILSGRDYARALADLDEAIRLDVKCVAAYALRGAIWQEKGDGEKAIRELNEAIRRAPRSVLAHLARAE